MLGRMVVAILQLLDHREGGVQRASLAFQVCRMMTNL